MLTTVGSGEGLLRTGGGLSQQSSKESSIGSSLICMCREGMGPPTAEEAWAPDCRAGMDTEEHWEAEERENEGELEERSGWWGLCGRKEG